MFKISVARQQLDSITSNECQYDNLDTCDRLTLYLTLFNI